MQVTEKETKVQMSVTPSTIIQVLVALLIAILGWTIKETLSDIRADIFELKNDVRQAQTNDLTFRNELSQLELGLRGDRFTRSDWNRQRQEIYEEFSEHEERIRALEAKH